MPREYFPSKFHLDNRVRYFLWSTEVGGEDIGRDEVWTRDGVAPTFATLAHVQAFAQDVVGVTFAQEGGPLLHELTPIDRWLHFKKSRRARRLDVAQCLSAWNVFADLARSLDLPFSGSDDAHTDLYMKLFFGEFSDDWFKGGSSRCLTRWSGAEIEEIHAVLHEGLKLWRAHVR